MDTRRYSSSLATWWIGASADYEVEEAGAPISNIARRRLPGGAAEAAVWRCAMGEMVVLMS